MPSRAGGLLRWRLIDRILHPPPSDPDRSSFAVATPAVAMPRAEPGAVVVTWVGHATFLVQIGGRNILTDPMWGERASPTTLAGPRRWVRPGIAFADLPPIDAVVQSHNHYDHLDDGTVRRLARGHPGARWFAPLGLASFLRKRGVGVVTEFDWWEERQADGVTYTCAPAQHFSARSCGAAGGSRPGIGVSTLAGTQASIPSTDRSACGAVRSTPPSCRSVPTSRAGSCAQCT